MGELVVCEYHLNLTETSSEESVSRLSSHFEFRIMMETSSHTDIIIAIKSCGIRVVGMELFIPKSSESLREGLRAVISEVLLENDVLKDKDALLIALSKLRSRITKCNSVRRKHFQKRKKKSICDLVELGLQNSTQESGGTRRSVSFPNSISPSPSSELDY